MTTHPSLRAIERLGLICASAALLACGKAAIQSDSTLGRVIVYRNGVAYFERSAVLEDDHLEMSVPDGQLDDFLKSLTVHDASSGALAPVSYRLNGQGSVDLKVRLAGPPPHRIKLSYVTEAPAWKPTYRVSLGKSGKVELQAWAIVDNTSGEDWNGIRLGVSSGSALSFRYDLRSVRTVARDRLEPEGLVAHAPPAGGSAYGGEAPPSAAGSVARLDDATLSALEGADAEGRDSGALLGRIEKAERELKTLLGRARTSRDVVLVTCLNDKLTQLGSVKRLFGGELGQAQASGDSAILVALASRGDRLAAEARECIGEELAYIGETKTTIDSGTDAEKSKVAKKGPMGGKVSSKPNDSPQRGDRDGDGIADTMDVPDRLLELDRRVAELKERVYRDNARVRLLNETVTAGRLEDASRRAEIVKGRLVKAGIPEDRIVIDNRNARAGQAGGLSILVEPPTSAGAAPTLGAPATVHADAKELDPITSSLFEFSGPLELPASSSVMLALYAGKADGEDVYYYDAESPRGNASFPFRAVRLRNPTRATLESGPVTVVAEGRFLGEGVSDPIPAGAWAFVPFALDRQIVAERGTSENDSIAKLVSGRRGVFTTRVDRTKRTHVTLFNRAAAKAVVYVRHTPAPGYALAKAPAGADRLGGARLFRIELPARGKAEVEILEKLPLERTLDVRSPEGARLIKSWVGGPDADPATKQRISALLSIQDEIAKLEERLKGKREQQKEHRERLRELNVQVVTLKTVKSSKRLLSELEKKLGEASDRVSRTTTDVVELDEQLTLARIRLQDALSELRIDEPSAPVAQAP